MLVTYIESFLFIKHNAKCFARTYLPSSSQQTLEVGVIAMSILEIGKLRQWQSCAFDQGHRGIKRCSQVSNMSFYTKTWGLSDTVLSSKHWLVTIRQAIWGFVLVLKEQRSIVFFLKNVWFELFPSNDPSSPPDLLQFDCENLIAQRSLCICDP